MTGIRARRIRRVHCGGGNKQGNPMEYTATDFSRIMQVNVTGAFSTARMAREMVEHGDG
ncbi:hypothetical protein B9Z19DRAFT_1080622 [Tuber borchii]|uniref:Uncharacterized protein n=1 Tax=Tuber borchii TaxID=42251 RepID=A0A2T6ZWM6_TUBBO|nr:hypothetical protein B9Z19DRAFT_1080622 [Tuber borchii]